MGQIWFSPSSLLDHNSITTRSPNVHCDTPIAIVVPGIDLMKEFCTNIHVVSFPQIFMCAVFVPYVCRMCAVCVPYV